MFTPTFRFHRIGLVLLTLHYFCDFITHAFRLAEIFDKNEKLATSEYNLLCL